ncbi:MAG: serine hydrolase [Rhizobacter sp.]|nr:serine hydrolase [Chlorobiales bacterium]
MNKGFLAIGGVLLAVLSLSIFTYFFLRADDDYIVSFIKSNPDKSSLIIVRNDTVLARANAETPMTLASVMKYIIAIDYAEQAAAGTVKPDEPVNLDTLMQFYVSKTDGDAHPNWLQEIETKKLSKGNAVPLEQVVRGMMKHSSNANADYLMARLGLRHINATIDSLGLGSHTEIFPIAGSLFVFQNPEKASEEKFLARVKAMSQGDYIAAAVKAHQRMHSGDTAFAQNFNLYDVTVIAQQAWSDRLPQASAEDYARVMKMINRRTAFSDAVQQRLDAVLESILDNPQNRTWLEHAGLKGGSTLTVLTHAFYARDKQGNQTEIVIFFNNLGMLERGKIQGNLNQFELSLLTDDAFREKVRAAFSSAK